MRAGRLVSLLLLLQARGQLTGEQLARELEVSVRTVYRDVEALSEAGVPIYADRGPLGGIRLVDGYRTRLTGLTTQEAEALFLSGLPGPAAELGLGTVVAAARLKVLAALPPELRNRASRISERFHFDAPGWFQAAEQLTHLETLADAVWRNRRVEIDYRRDEEVVERRLEPLGLVLKAGVWYLVARSGASMRTYRVSRVLAVRTTDEAFERPSDFDLARYWGESLLAYEATRPRVAVTLVVAERDLERVEDAVGMRTMRDAVREPDSTAPGSLRLTLRFDWIDEAEAAVFRLGHLVEVIEPADVRERLIKLAKAVLARYESRGIWPESNQGAATS